MKRKKKGILALIAAFAVLLLAGCSHISTQPDEVGLHYKAGSFSSTKFANCVNPGTKNFDGPGDLHFLYPAGQRTYDFTGGKNSDSDAYQVPSKDNVQLGVSGILTFNLNITCATLKRFHEQIGLKYQPILNDDGTTGTGWDHLLDNYLGQPLKLAITQATTGLDWKDLYNNASVKSQWENAVDSALPSLIESQTGGVDYFDNVHVTLQKPTIPTALQAALEQAQEAIQQNLAQKQRNIQVDSQLEAIKALVKVLGVNGYNVYQAIVDGKITILPVPEGTNITIPGSK